MKRKRSEPESSALPDTTVIPGLVREVYQVGSSHTCSEPILTRSNVDADGMVDFAWEAHGSSVYDVKAWGKVTFAGWRGLVPRYKGLFASCSCPSGRDQCLAPLSVCKHGRHALASVLDPAAEAELSSKISRRKNEQKAMPEISTRRAEEKELAGERKRIENGLAKLSPAAIVAALQQAIKTADGLRAASRLFSPDVMPAKNTRHCVRCDRQYDLGFAEDLVCRVEHPEQRCSTRWDTSKKHWRECDKCGGCFNINGFSRFGRASGPIDDGPYCFEGPHTQDEALVESEGWEDEY